MRFYSFLLCLYPTAFRHEYGDEMRAVFRERWRAAGSAGRLALLLSAILEETPNAAASHLDLLRADVRQALRSFRGAPAYAATAVAVIALGVGANSAVFSVTDHALFRPLPFPDAHRLVKLWERRAGYGQMELSPANYRDWKARLTTVQAIASYNWTAANLVDEEREPVRLDGAEIEADLLEVLGVTPTRGRALSAADEALGAANVVLISQRLWQSRFAGSEQILGRMLELDGGRYSVVGVLPSEFRFPNRRTDYWLPLRLPESAYQDRNDNYLEVVARLAPGVEIPALRADLERITQQLEAAYPVANQDAGATIVPLRRQGTSRARPLLIALAGAAAFILAIACINLTNLQLARALARRRELLVRTVMGAGRERLVRQLLTESLLLACLGGALGLAVAAGSLPLLTRLVPTNLPIDAQPAIDSRVLVFALAVTLLTGVVVGLLPVLQATRSGLAELRSGGRDGGPPRERVRSALVVASMVCSVVLLVGSGLLLRALLEVQSTSPGFEKAEVLTLRTALPSARYAQTHQRTQWLRQVLEGIETIPGVESAGYISFLPMTMTGGIWPVLESGEDAGRREQGNVASLRFVTPGLHRALQIPLLRGRALSWADDQNQPFVAVVSQSFVDRYFPDREPIGKRFHFAFFDREIVGVYGDVRVRGLERSSEPQVYLPVDQVPDGGLSFYAPKDLAIRANLPVETLLPAVRQVIRGADPQQAISHVQTLEQIVAEQTNPRAVQLRVVMAFAGLAALLAAIGLHGLLSFLVAQRRREIGVRMALGASRSRIVSLVLRRGALLTVLGVGIGLLIALGVGRVLEALLAGVPASDPLTLITVAALCLAVGLVGSSFPTLRAARIDPTTAMRVE